MQQICASSSDFSTVETSLIGLTSLHFIFASKASAYRTFRWQTVTPNAGKFTNHNLFLKIYFYHACPNAQLFTIMLTVLSHSPSPMLTPKIEKQSMQAAYTNGCAHIRHKRTHAISNVRTNTMLSADWVS